MKKLIGLLGAFLVLGAAVFAADPAAGLWKSIDDKTGEVTAIWKIYEKDGMLFRNYEVYFEEYSIRPAKKEDANYF